MLTKLTNKNPLLPAIIILLIVFIMLVLAFFLSKNTGLSPLPSPTRLPLIATSTPSPFLSPTPAATATDTPRPTWTLRPTTSSTVTPTPTETGTPGPVALLTPEKPLKFNDLYRLRTWQPSDAENAVIQLQSFPDNQFYDPTQRNNPAYDADFAYPALAIREALLRFPGDPAAAQWRWWLAYDLAHVDDPQAGAIYAALITEALNARQVSVSGLPDWFSKQEYRLSLEVSPLTPAPGYLSNQIVAVKTIGGAAYLWLLESPKGFQSHLLASHFDFADKIESQYQVGDLTGDGKNEVIVSYSPIPGNDEFTPPQVFSLASVPPPQLPFAPAEPFDLGDSYTGEWSIQGSALQFTATLFPTCPAHVNRSYRWNSQAFTLEKTGFQLQPDLNLLAYCEIDVNHSAAFWSPEATIQLMETLLPAWPPKTNMDGKPYPADAKDEWRYRLAVLKALAGDPSAAKSELNNIAQNPSVASSQWAAKAQQFLAVYQTPEDLYRACVQSAGCDPRLALERLGETIPVEDYDRIPELLGRFGVTLRSSGFFDFENDGEPERWILVRHHPIDKLEFWVFARTPESIQALFVDTSDSDNPAPHFHEPMDTPPVVQIKMHAGFIFKRVPPTASAYITPVDVEFIPTTYTRDTLQAAMNSLFSGDNPEKALNSLVSLQKSGRFNCLNYRICDRFFYILGLTYELTGHTQETIDTYIQLWWENINSPLTLLARLKLELIPTSTPPPTATRTPTKTGTVTFTPNPNATATPSPTITNTPNPNITATPTPTVTQTPNPNETSTVTVTPTVTPTGGTYP